ncbi:hypothetical protein [Neobacillus bataviensis]|uniref:hypothetical protein n=1 Tax=Neobacillus bataviensis TaxID=220685 RepID=UPI001CBF5145|nr:hypothetical protein [Neobacillus bataviensis]
MNKQKFIEWLEKNTNIIQYSIRRYAAAIDTLSSELGNYGISERDLFNISDTTIIDRILINPEFKKKNTKGNRMYSAALNHFKSYIDYLNDNEFEQELLKEEKEFEKYLSEYNIDVSNIVDKPKDKPNHRTVNNKKVWIRNPKFASEAVQFSNFLCEFNNDHKYFISKYNQKNYVEAHHLIPMKYQDKFNCSLDIHANIVSICLVCHKKIHFGLFQEKKEIISKLFNSRKERLLNSGITIGIEELYSYYQD